MDDRESEEVTKRTLNFLEEIQSGDIRRSYIAARDYVAHELQGNRCRACQMSQLRTGDTAALVLRLTQIIDAIAALPPEVEVEDELDALRNRRANSRPAEAQVPPPAELGTKSAPRRSGSRKQSR